MWHICHVAVRDISFLEALGRGVALTRAAPGVVGLALGAEVGGDLLSFAAGVSLAASLFSVVGHALAAPGLTGSALLRGTPLLAVVGAVAVASLLALALRLVFASVGARLFSARLAGESLSFGQAFAQARFDRAVPVAALYAVLSLAVALFDAALLTSAALIVAHAQQAKGFAFSGAAALSAGLVVALALGLLLTLLARLWLIRAVATDQTAVLSLSGALALIGRRIGTLCLFMLLFGVLGGIAAMVASTGGLLLALGGGAEFVAVGLTARAAAGLLASGFRALFATAELGALAALDAGARGTLPEPPLAVPILPTQPILGTEKIEFALLVRSQVPPS